MRTFVQSLLVLAAVCALAPARADLYKWVDERGVTNYSNEPPPNAARANKLTRVESTISVYTPDESFMQAVKALRERSIKALAEPEPERQGSPVSSIAVPPQSGYERCLLSGRLGCEDLYGYSPYLPAVAVFPARGVRPTRFLTPPPPVIRSDGSGASRAPLLR